MKPLYCDFCSVEGGRATILAHEVECIYNPSNKKCSSCVYLVEHEPADACDLGLRVFNDVHYGDAKCSRHKG